MKSKFLDIIKKIDKDKKNKISFVGTDSTRKVIKKYESGKNKPDEVSLNNELTKMFFEKNPANEKDLVEAPMEAWRIFFLTLGLIKSTQVHASRPIQLELFNNEFLTNDNAFVGVVLDIKEINSDRKREKIKKAVDFLQNNLTSWVVSKNYKGEEVNTKLSFIEKPSFTRGKLYFETSVFWMEKMAHLKEYNEILFKLPFILNNSKQFFFTLFLEFLPENQFTPINLETLNKRYNLNYADAKSFAKGFLMSLKIYLDQNNQKSFTYKVSKNQILIKPYRVSMLTSEEIILTQQAKIKIKNRYSISYLKLRHKINEESLKHIKNIFDISMDKNLMDKAYDRLKKRMREQKKLMTELIDKKFLEEWQREINEEYKLTQAYIIYPNGYPKIL